MCSCSQPSITSSLRVPFSNKHSNSLSARSAKNLEMASFSAYSSSSLFRLAIALSSSTCAGVNGCLITVFIILYINFECKNKQKSGKCKTFSCFFSKVSKIAIFGKTFPSILRTICSKDKKKNTGCTSCTSNT